MSTSTLTKSRATDQSSATVSDHPEPLALRLSDSQLDDVMRLCRPLAPRCRDALLRILAHELRGRRDVGDGELHRLTRAIIADNHLFDPPLESHLHSGGKYR
jgi:hypothetical protein